MGLYYRASTYPGDSIVNTFHMNIHVDEGMLWAHQQKPKIFVTQNLFGYTSS